MNKKKNFIKIFFILLFLSFIVVSLSARNLLTPESSLVQKLFFSLNPHFSFNKPNTQLDLLKAENAKLEIENAKLQNLENENKALYDQFKTTFPAPSNLLPAKIIGFPDNFETNNINNLVINQGLKAGISKNETVVFQNNFIGIITDENNYYSKVSTLFSGDFSLSAEDLKTQAFGIVKAENGEIILDNVLTSDHLNKGDLIETAPGKNLDKSAVDGDLVIGKVLEVESVPSSLFQKAVVVPLIDFKRLNMVFVID